MFIYVNLDGIAYRVKSKLKKLCFFYRGVAFL